MLIRSAMIVSRCKGLCRLGKWLLRRLRVRVVLLTDKDGKELNKQMNYFAEVVLFDATFWQDISPRKIGFLLKDFPDKNVAIFNMTYLEPEKAALFIRYGARSYFDMSGSGSFWTGLKKGLFRLSCEESGNEVKLGNGYQGTIRRAA